MNDAKREKSNMELWAEEEIRIACKRERGNTSENEWDYGVACYESALKAFRSLAEDGHSGMSIGITLDILNKLVKGQALMPIDDVDDCKYLKRHYTPADYQEAAMRTADPKLNTEESLLEGLIGLNSEAGEALDIYKKHVFQKHDLDKEKIALELGDALWYLTEAAVAIGCSLDDIMEMNIEKLRKRYPYGFDPEKSRNRKD